MAEEETKEVPEKKVEVKKEGKTSVRSYQHGIDVEKHKMATYSKEMGTSVRSLKSDFKKYSKDVKVAASNMREEGAKQMADKINKFKGDIKTANRSMNEKVNKFNQNVQNQIKENKEAVSHIKNGVKFLISQCHKKKRDFKAYAHGPFNDYIKQFWGV